MATRNSMTADEENLDQIEAQIANLSDDEQLRVRCIANTLRCILKVGGALALLAFARVAGRLTLGKEP